MASEVLEETLRKILNNGRKDIVGYRIPDYDNDIDETCIKSYELNGIKSKPNLAIRIINNIRVWLYKKSKRKLKLKMLKQIARNNAVGYKGVRASDVGESVRLKK